jgi:leucyl-tRNA synthetase
MPWCEGCDRLVENADVTDGGCPTCGEPLEERRRVPWHFKLLLWATVIYLGYRTYQGIGWLVHHA